MNKKLKIKIFFRTIFSFIPHIYKDKMGEHFFEEYLIFVKI